MNFVNLTPHELTIYNDDNNVIRTIPPSGGIVRVESIARPAGTLDGIPLVEMSFSTVDMPEPKNDTIYIVSTLAINALPHPRYDVVSPDTSPDSVIRDDAGRIVGVRRFQRIAIALMPPAVTAM